MSVNMKEGNCEVCDSVPFKYTCPRCDVKTCSLKCVKIHKEELTCNGYRDKAAYVSLSKFDNLTLLSDYRFLEDIDRTISTCRRNPQKRYTRYQQPLPTHLYRLKSAAERRSIRLQFLPQHFSRHRENKSILKYDTQIIHWKLDLIFPQGELIQVQEVVDENCKLGKLLDKYLDPVQCPPLYKNYLKFYHSCGASNIDVLLKAERRREKYAVYMLDMSYSVNENLANRTIIENPVLYVIKKDYIHEYTVLEEDEMEVTNKDLRGNNLGYFGDFNPINYFTNTDERKKPTEGEKALDSILSSAKELRGGSGRVKEEMKPTTPFVRGEPVCYKELNIPSYDTL